MERETVLENVQLTGIRQDEDGRYRWIYELPMMRSFFLLLEVWKVLGLSALIVMLPMSIISLFADGDIDVFFSSVGMGILCLLILMVLSVPAYYIVTKANNGLYTVLFEMDDEGIDHIQIKTEKAKALDILVTFMGVQLKNRTTTAAGLLSASGGSLYSRFAKVKKIRAYPTQNLITVDGLLFRNQVYVDSENFDFVYDYIVSHCPGARAQ